MRKYLIEREVPRVEQLREATAKSNYGLCQLGPDIQWVESFITARQDVLRVPGRR